MKGQASARSKFETRRIRLVGQTQVETALALIRNLPVDSDKPLEIVVREEVKARKLDQNAAMWAGPLRDIAEQAYVHGRNYSADIWHQYFKEKFLPEEYDPELCRSEQYRKWDYDMAGKRRLVGSTTDLTVKGFALYMQQIEAEGAGLGVQFHANPNDARRAA